MNRQYKWSAAIEHEKDREPEEGREKRNDVVCQERVRIASPGRKSIIKKRAEFDLRCAQTRTQQQKNTVLNMMVKIF